MVSRLGYAPVPSGLALAAIASSTIFLNIRALPFPNLFGGILWNRSPAAFRWPPITSSIALIALGFEVVSRNHR
jgi:hypothetical protein